MQLGSEWRLADSLHTVRASEAAVLAYFPGSAPTESAVQGMFRNVALVRQMMQSMFHFLPCIAPEERRQPGVKPDASQSSATCVLNRSPAVLVL